MTKLKRNLSHQKDVRFPNLVEFNFVCWSLVASVHHGRITDCCGLKGKQLVYYCPSLKSIYFPDTATNIERFGLTVI